MDQPQDKRGRTEPWKNLTLAQYVLCRNGVPLGDGRSLQNMLHRSLGASSFAGFWQYWNPIWGYGLGKYVYAPLRRFMLPVVAFILTFVISGAVHDLVITAVRGSLVFLFTPWFLFLSVGAVMGRVFRMNLAERPWPLRAGVNLAYLGSGLALTLVVRELAGLP